MFHDPESIQIRVQRVLTRPSHRERIYRSPVLLVGRQLEWLSNNRYRAGGHLVRSYPETGLSNETEAPPTPPAPYRYSIVFVLRAHSPIPINTDELTTPITGHFFRPLWVLGEESLFYLGILSFPPKITSQFSRNVLH
jgi:hypothetical protein